jgi:tRNA threonylcarbamoyladenosine biosynthesis protein TsaB
MIILGIETSGSVGSVALLDGHRVLAEYTFPEGTRHARSLMPAVDNVVSDAGIDKGDISAVAVSQGPGAFTGLRIGVTCAKTMAYALDWQVVGVCSLEVLAQNVTPPADVDQAYACPVQDARRNRVYTSVFEWADGAWCDTTGVLLKDPVELAESLPDGAVVFGTGVDAYPDHFLCPRFRQAPAEATTGRATAVARLGAHRIADGVSTDPMALVPLYYRLTAPEEKLANSRAAEKGDLS